MSESDDSRVGLAVTKPLSERLSGYADAEDLQPSERETLREAAALARRVEESAKAIGSRDACTDECASIIMHIGNGGRAKDARGKWFHLLPVEVGS